MADYGSMNEFGTMLIGTPGIGSYTTGIHESYHAVDYAYSENEALSSIVCRNAASSLGIEVGKPAYNILAVQITKDIDDARDPRELLAYSAEAVTTKQGNNRLSESIINELRKAIK